jgi:PEP-CTERM motif-containing protein
MRIRSSGLYLFLFVALCILTVGVSSAKADMVGLSGGGFIFGSTVITLNVFGNPVADTAVPWALTSTLGPSWTNSNILGTGVFEDLGPYMLFVLTGNTLDVNGSGLQSQVAFALSGTVSQFAALLAALPVGQSTQVPLLTVAGGGCASGVCSGETDSRVLFGNLVGQTIENLIPPAWLTITNDPGLYNLAVTSTPLQQQTPEPSSLFLLGTGLLGIGGAIRRKFRA